MKLNKSKFALAAASVMGVWSIICTILVAVAPAFTLKLFSWMVHLINLEAGVATFPEAVFGVVEVFVLTYVTAYIFAWLHNRFVEPAAQ